jgi:hypothetical protein
MIKQTQQKNKVHIDFFETFKQFNAIRTFVRELTELYA